VLFNIDNIGRHWSARVARGRTAKGILAAIAVGLATGSASQAGTAFGTLQKDYRDLDKIANAPTGFGLAAPHFRKERHGRRRRKRRW